MTPLPCHGRSTRGIVTLEAQYVVECIPALLKRATDILEDFVIEFDALRYPEGILHLD